MRDPAIRYPEIVKNPFTAVPLAFCHALSG